MAKISAKISDELEEQMIECTDYPNKRKSDVIREALEIYVSMENPDELICKPDSK